MHDNGSPAFCRRLPRTIPVDFIQGPGREIFDLQRDRRTQRVRFSDTGRELEVARNTPRAGKCKVHVQAGELVFLEMGSKI